MDNVGHEKDFTTGDHIENMNTVQLNNINLTDEKSKHVKNGTAATCMKTTGILVMLLGLIVSVLNIIFIYFGMNSAWYAENIGVLNIISVGEGSSTFPRRILQL
jgi:hypothetical protein